MDQASIQAFITSADPLSDEALRFLLEYHEEDLRIDYKEAFHSNEEREWLEITKDIMAFANTFGGYLVFGVRDATYDILGIDESTVASLTDVNNFQQKINRYVEPSILYLRAKSFDKNGVKLVALFIPRLEGRTHVVYKDGKFKFPSDDERIVLHKGTIYVRRSGGNHLVDSRDMDELVARRLEEFRSSLLSKIARVVEAPPQSEIFVISSDPKDADSKKVVIGDGPESILVKGMSFTVAPETPEQEVAGWISILQKTSYDLPPVSVLLKWYAQRASLQLSTKQKLALARFNMIAELPPFFWLRDAMVVDIRVIIRDAVTRVDRERIDSIMYVATFVGRKFFDSIVRKFKEPKRCLSYQMLHYQATGSRSILGDEIIRGVKESACKGDETACRKYFETELDAIVGSVDGDAVHELSREDRWRARVYDSYLYAQDDKYVKPGETEEDGLPTKTSMESSESELDTASSAPQC